MFNIDTPVFISFLLIFSIGFLVLKRHYSAKTALVIASIKSLFFIFFYTWVYDGFSIYGDSFVYRHESTQYFTKFKNPFEFFYDFKNFKYNLKILRDIAEGMHFMYGWLNHLVDYFIGIHDASPAALNVALTFPSAIFFYEILKRSGFDVAYSKLATIFYLLHWDIVTWSTVFNLKETFLNFCILYLLYCYVRLQTERNLLLYMNAFLALLCLFFTRFYLFPFILLAVLITQFQWNKTYLKKVGVLSLYAILPLILVFIIFSIDTLTRVMGYLDFGLTTPIYIGRFFLTPIPVNMTNNAKYEFLSASLNLLAFPLFTFGFYKLFRDKPKTRLLLFICIIIAVFYSGLPMESVGSRHRIQIISIIILCQFHTLYLMYTEYKGPNAN